MPLVNPATPGHRPVSERLRSVLPKAKDAIKLALQWLDRSPTLVFPNNSVDIFLAEENGYSLGYRWMENGGHTTGAAILLGRTAVSWTGTANTKTIAQECYEHYKPTWTVSAMERRIMATLIHKMGHVFHQMQNLVHYIALARVDEMYQLANPAGNAGYADLANAPSQADLVNFRSASCDFGYGASLYAGNSGLNEFVAETFCALVMGSPLGFDQNSQSSQLMNKQATNADILAAYAACGGPLPEVGIRHVR
jgi:hypothetical protein